MALDKYVCTCGKLVTVQENGNMANTENSTKQLKLDIPTALHRRLKLAAAERGVTMKSVVISHLERWTGQAQDGRKRGVVSPRPDIST